MEPMDIRGFGGETVSVECTSSVGTISMSLSNGDNITEIAEFTGISADNIKVRLILSQRLNGYTLACWNVKHPEVMAISLPIQVTYIEQVARNFQVIWVTGNVNIDCADNLNTNGKASYWWHGPYLVSRLRGPKISIRYAQLVAAGTHIIECTVQIRGDPLERLWSFAYVLDLSNPSFMNTPVLDNTLNPIDNQDAYSSPPTDTKTTNQAPGVYLTILVSGVSTFLVVVSVIVFIFFELERRKKRDAALNES